MRTPAKIPYQPDYLVAPGESIAETITALAMTQKEFAKRLGITEQSLIRILKAEQPITYETAAKLEMVTGTPASFWNALESKYREALTKKSELLQFQAELEWLKTIPYRRLVDQNYAEQSTDPALQVRESLAFYGVSSVDAWRAIWEEPKVAARRSHCFETHLGAASAWIRMGELAARKVQTEPYREQEFKQALQEIRGLTRLSASEFSQKMVDRCAQAGVAVVFVPEIPKVPWSGASKWLSPQKAMILLSLRGKSEDKLWFSFFHEASHILHDDKKNLYIADGSQDAAEQRADCFAAEMLIPAHFNDEIKACISDAQIQRIARKIGVSEGIVAGRWQHLHQCYSRFNGLKRKLVWG